MGRPVRTSRLSALQRDQGHGRRKRAKQPGTQAARRRLELLQALSQRRLDPPLQIDSGRLAIEIPIGLEQFEHASFDHVTGHPGRNVSAGTPPVRCLVDRAPGPAHPVEDRDQAQVGPLAQIGSESSP